MESYHTRSLTELEFLWRQWSIIEGTGNQLFTLHPWWNSWTTQCAFDFFQEEKRSLGSHWKKRRMRWSTYYELEQSVSTKISSLGKGSYSMLPWEGVLRRKRTTTSVWNNYPPSIACHAIIRYWHIWFFCVPVTWCARAYNEDDLAGESSYTGKVCL